jgi:hypothetical protein
VRAIAPPVLSLALIACASAVADAQLRASMSIGGGEVGYGIVPASAVMMNGWVDLERGWLEGSATASTYRFEDNSASSGSATASLMLRPPRRAGLSGELLALGSTTNHHSFYRARRVEGRAGATWVGDVAEATVRYGLARLSHDRISLTSNRVEIEATSGIGPATISLFGQRASFNDAVTVTRDTTYVVAGFPFRGRYRTEEPVSRSYLDAEARVGMHFRAATWSLALGARRGDATTANERWQRLDIHWPLNRNVALIATGGRKPAVPEERLPSGTFGILGVQFSFQEDPPRLVDVLIDGRDAPRLVALDIGEGRRSISIIGLSASRVEIIADFTEWKAIELAEVGDDVWHITLPVTAGAHRVSIRVDGGRWMPPPGLPVTADEFMGTVGVLLIE